MQGFKLSTGVVVSASCAAIVVILMALAVVNYLSDTYGNASIRVSVLASLIVIVSIAVPCWQAQRMRARKAQRLAAQG